MKMSKDLRMRRYRVSWHPCLASVCLPKQPIQFVLPLSCLLICCFYDSTRARASAICFRPSQTLRMRRRLQLRHFRKRKGKSGVKVLVTAAPRRVIRLILLAYRAFRRACAGRLHKIATRAFLVVRGRAGGVGERFFFRREKWFEATFVDRFHESFVRGDNALFEQRPDGVVHKLHTLRPTGNDYVLEFLRCPFANDGGDRGI